MTTAVPIRRPMPMEKWAELDEDIEGELADGELVEEEMPNTRTRAGGTCQVAWRQSRSCARPPLTPGDCP